MKLIQPKDFNSDRYYLCYEKMGGLSNYLVVGKSFLEKKEEEETIYSYVIKNAVLYYEKGDNIISRWYLYDEDSKVINTQIVFELSEEEVLTHVLMETI